MRQVGGWHDAGLTRMMVSNSGLRVLGTDALVHLRLRGRVGVDVDAQGGIVVVALDRGAGRDHVGVCATVVDDGGCGCGSGSRGWRRG